MCGLIFLHDEALAQADLKAKAKVALDRMVHRGPDDEGVECRAPTVSGHRRLSIIDLADSHQPMCDSTDRYVLVYNGEIYNYRQLRDSLRDHWHFRTQGDTEVLLAGLILKGADFLKKAEGMWAFALWDREDQSLLMGRDRMGKKPLYFEATRDRFAAASELPALSALSRDQWEEDLDSTADYLRYGLYLPGTTAYKHVREVLPGHTLSWKPAKEPVSHPYWSLNVGGFSGNQSAACKSLRKSFREAVERRLVADVEVGAFLSGGVDSSLVVAVLSEWIGVKPKSFTIGFSDAAYDESGFAATVAQQCGTEHHVQRLESWDPDRLRTLVLHHVGEPFADSSILPTFAVSELAAQHVKVALSGDGGDELFGGYQRYQARVLLQWYTRLPKTLRRSIERIVRVLPEPMAHHSRSILKKAHLFLDVAGRMEVETPYVASAAYSSERFRRLAPDLVGRGHSPPNLPGETNIEDIHRMMVADSLIYLPQDILTKVDRASMATSLEVRAPFLDTDVVETAFSLPRRWHRRGFSGKRMLRRAFDGLLPAKVWQRRKQGFAVPVHRWFREDMGHELEDLVGAVRSPLSAREVRSMLHEHRCANRDHGYRLWAIYVYLLWTRSRRTLES